MKEGTTEGHFQHEGKEDSTKHLLNSLERIDDSSGEHLCKTITGILSGPEAVEELSLEMTLATD